ncbi:geraniol 8-hydroxylase isoform X1 [Neltuma alba]|uniref:geraniol 8-hydroxylase isoform X1 n=1 Tax=Neltuma alba TaxID=207710 RepID=UPI0010A372E8|nr:geraniol 8-hydroxylase-like isoform X1 [Prosopis alba]
MDFLSYMLLLIFVICIFVQFLRLPNGRSNRRNRKLPPGPTPFPIIGNLLELGHKPHKSLAKLANIYGPIMSLQLGRVTTIVVTSVDMAKGVLLTHDRFLSNRTVPDAVTALNHHEYSLSFLPVSPRWRALRKLCNNQLFGNKALDASQDLRRSKVQQLIKQVHQSSEVGEAVDIGKAAFKTSINLLSNSVFSVDLVESVDKTGEFKETVVNILKEIGRPNVADYFPILKKIDPLGVRSRTTIHVRKMLDVFHLLVTQRLKLRETTGSLANNDILDALLSEENRQEMDGEMIQRLSLDLFVAGSDTTSSTLEWGMAELLRNPEAMSKAKAELEETIGKGKPVEESDEARLPYLQAVVKETLRLHPAAPFLLPRKAEMDVELGGYTIPKGAQVLVNVWAIGRDQSIWKNPEEFSPERFLGSDIDVKGRDFELIPFGAGRRVCPGYPLALRMVFLVLGSLINCFDWKMEGGTKPEDMDMDDKFGITLEKAQPVLVVPYRANKRRH